MTLLLAAAHRHDAWELVNPVSMLHRGLIFGLGAAWTVILAIFLFDLFVMRRLVRPPLPGRRLLQPARKSPSAQDGACEARACNDCMDCFEVCPEPQVIRPGAERRGKGAAR
jgi:ferredoxin-type protein NapH